MSELMFDLQSFNSAVSDFSSPLNYGSIADEAKVLVRRCAEPCPAGDSVKEAIRRASGRLGFSFSRTQDIWYGEARRIDAREMDQLRAVADAAEIALAIRSIETLHRRVSVSNSPMSREIMHRLDACLRTLGGDPFRKNAEAGRRPRA